MPSNVNISLCVPVLNAGVAAPPFLKALSEQTLVVDRFLAIDSSSDDESAGLFRHAGFEVFTICRESFDHGGTRRLAASLCAEADILVLLTQDSVLAEPDALQRLVEPFADPQVAAVYGRQLPRPFAGAIEAHARLFNYPAQARSRSATDTPAMGIKAAFFSNSFAAYRMTALSEVGSFPPRCIVSEDTLVTACLLKAGWTIVYAAAAKAYHSHNYSLGQEFQRYFDIGVFHSHEPWLRQAFGRAEGEGRKFVVSELKYLWRKAPALIPLALTRTIVKYFGYRLGVVQQWLPQSLRCRLSMQKSYWRTSQS